MLYVRAIDIDRARSSVVDVTQAVDSPWRVAFRLNPLPPRPWDDHFETVLRDHKQLQKLAYQHLLLREPRDVAYHYGRRRRPLWDRLTMSLLRKRRLSVYVTCAPSAEHLRAATNELAHLIAEANARYAQSKQKLRSLAVAENVATERLDRAIADLEKSLKGIVPEASLPRSAVFELVEK